MRTSPLAEPIVIAAGTRPEIIKLAPVYFAARAKFGPVVRWVSTGQHRELEAETMRSFGIECAHRLDAGQEGRGLVTVGGRIVERFTQLIAAEKPSLVLVQGDTVSAYAAAFAAFHARTPVVHVEAGLRTYDSFDPYPEEAYRRMIDILSTIHLAPTRAAAANLLAEGCRADTVYVTGNTAVDAMALVGAVSARQKPPVEAPPRLPGMRQVLVTLHRRESWGERLHDMCLAIRDIADQFEDVQIVFPVHVNPVVHAQVEPLLAEHPRITLLQPLDYAACHVLISRADLILTDSGGIQEEAPSYGIPVLVLRRRTERPEGLSEGTAVLTGTDRKRIVEDAHRVLSRPATMRRAREHRNPFGDGHAADRVVIAIDRFLRGERILLTDEEQFGWSPARGTTSRPAGLNVRSRPSTHIDKRLVRTAAAHGVIRSRQPVP